jgi:hypothetical protein
MCQIIFWSSLRGEIMPVQSPRTEGTTVTVPSLGQFSAQCKAVSYITVAMQREMLMQPSSGHQPHLN